MISWHEMNQQFLVAALERVRGQLEHHARERTAAPVTPLPPSEPDAVPALVSLAETFHLTAFEIDVLLLCAGMELDAGFPRLCSEASDGRRPFPTFSLTLAALPGGHWSALTPTGALRYFRLIDVEPSDGLAYSRLRCDERIVHHLAGVSWLDTRLHGVIEALSTTTDTPVPAAHAELATRLAGAWRRGGHAPVQVQLCGGDLATREAIVQRGCAAIGAALRAMHAVDIPTQAHEREALARLWEREAALAPTALLVHLDDRDSAETQRALIALADRLVGMVAIASRDPVRLRRRIALRFDVPAPTTDEQRTMWRDALGDVTGADGIDLGRVVAQFNLGPHGIRAASTELAERRDAAPDGALDPMLWQACRSQARPRLDDLAERIAPRAGWDDLVLPIEQTRMLRGVAAHVRQRTTVYERWGFADKGARGLGITALFAGASGTGKTMAAEVLSAELQLDLYRIDLSQVVSKYIGETEKNLRRIFDAAEEGGAILLFDEADALFGKRSEVKDSHDRYANLEISYLLQRMEQYRGLAILTTNMRAALDTAFLRRLRFVIEFPFPGIEERTAIWQRVFPAATPTEALAVDRLAKLNVTGGVIRNIALNAAFLAADAGLPVRMTHLRTAAEIEFIKLERPLSDADVGAWK